MLQEDSDNVATTSLKTIRSDNQYVSSDLISPDLVKHLKGIVLQAIYSLHTRRKSKFA